MNFLSIIEKAPNTIKRRLEQLKFLKERPDYHPEPSVFHHIEIVTERLAQTKDNNLIMAGILHDICKFDVVKMNEKTGWPTSPGHDVAAYKLIMDDTFESIEIRNWIIKQGAIPKTVANICKAHMTFHRLNEMRESKKDAYIKEWTLQNIWKSLQIFGAADNMLEEFDLQNLEKSWKFNKETI